MLYAEESEGSHGFELRMLVCAYEPGTLPLPNSPITTPTQSTFFGFYLQVFRRAGPPKRVDRLASMGYQSTCLPCAMIIDKTV